MELVELIISFVVSPRNLASLSQTCMMFQKLTVDKLYAPVVITNSKAAAFADAIESSPDRKGLAREVAVNCETKTDDD